MSRRTNTVGLQLCELVIVDEGTHRVTPVNCFSRRQVKGVLPIRLDFYVFAVVTSGQGTVTARISIERLDTLVPMYQKKFTMRFADPLQDVWAAVHVRECSFPYFGGYQAALTIDNEIIALRRFTLYL